jgi:hypothetical protein
MDYDDEQSDMVFKLFIKFCFVMASLLIICLVILIGHYVWQNINSMYG